MYKIVSKMSLYSAAVTDMKQEKNILAWSDLGMVRMIIFRFYDGLQT